MDHTSDPNAIKFNFDGARTDLAREFLANPMGPYSPELWKLLSFMRRGPVAGRHVLIVLGPGRWQLGQLPAASGQKVVRFEDVEFDNLADAERHIFTLRWEQLSGNKLDV
jgi:hypothetical protein